MQKRTEGQDNIHALNCHLHHALCSPLPCLQHLIPQACDWRMVQTATHTAPGRAAPLTRNCNNHAQGEWYVCHTAMRWMSLTCFPQDHGSTFINPRENKNSTYQQFCQPTTKSYKICAKNNNNSLGLPKAMHFIVQICDSTRTSLDPSKKSSLMHLPDVMVRGQHLLQRTWREPPKYHMIETSKITVIGHQRHQNP